MNDQERLDQSTRAHATLGAAAIDIGHRLPAVHAASAPQTPRRPGTLVSGSTDGPADPVHSQIAELETLLRRRGGTLHRCAILLDDLDALASNLDADHRLGAPDRTPTQTLKLLAPRRIPEEIIATHPDIRPTIRTGPIGARLHQLPALARIVEREIQLLNDAIYDAWRQLWRDGDDRYHDTLDLAVTSYAGAASYAASIAAALKPHTTPQPVRICDCGPDCCPDGCNDRLWTTGRRISERCKKRQHRARRGA